MVSRRDAKTGIIFYPMLDRIIIGQVSSYLDEFGLHDILDAARARKRQRVPVSVQPPGDICHSGKDHDRALVPQP